MAVTIRTGAALTRRRFLTTAAATAAATMVGGVARPYLSRAADRPIITHGVASGDVSVNSGVVWARADRASRMLVEVGDHRQFPEPTRSGSCRCAAGNRFHRQGADRRPARRAGHLLSNPLPGPCVAHHSAARRRSAVFAPRPANGDRCHSCGRAILPAAAGASMRSRGGMRTYATMARCSAGFFHPLRRPHLCRLPDLRAAAAAERRNLEQPRHRGQVQGRADVGGLSRQLQIQPARSQPARVQCASPAVRAMGRSRGDQRLDSGRTARMGRLCRQERAAACGPRLPRFPRVHADASDAGGGRRESIGKFHTGRCSTSLCSTCVHIARSIVDGDDGGAHILGPRRPPGSSAN